MAGLQSAELGLLGGPQFDEPVTLTLGKLPGRAGLVTRLDGVGAWLLKCLGGLGQGAVALGVDHAMRGLLAGRGLKPKALALGLAPTSTAQAVFGALRGGA